MTSARAQVQGSPLHHTVPLATFDTVLGSVAESLGLGARARRKSIAGHDWFAADEDIERLFGTRE